MYIYMYSTVYTHRCTHSTPDGSGALASSGEHAVERKTMGERESEDQKMAKRRTEIHDRGRQKDVKKHQMSEGRKQERKNTKIRE